MSESRAPELGINSWLEDELYQQYLNDRKNVDESWKEVFETNGGAASPADGAGQANGSHAPQPARALQNGETAPAPARPAPEHRAVDGETLMPLRGAAARIAENMNASLTHSAGHFAARDAGESDRRESPHNERAPRADRQEQDFLHAHHRLGDREGASDQSVAESRLRGNQRPSRFAWCGSR